MKSLNKDYQNQKLNIESRLKDFKAIESKNYLNELLFCLLTPQSQAQKCWKAVQELDKIDLKNTNIKEIANILKSKTRFHNNKAKYVKETVKNWENIKKNLNNKNVLELRNWLAENVSGMGYKEASHFLRNIGKSNNQIAILDRHILRNLHSLKVIKSNKLKGKNHYFEAERQFLSFAKETKIPIDHLDLLFWSQENGEIFK